MNYNKKYKIYYQLGGSELQNEHTTLLDTLLHQHVEREASISDIQLELESMVNSPGPQRIVRPIVTINNITFTITSRLINPQQPTRIFFMINSEDQEGNHSPFLVYKSNSDIGIWRFLVLHLSSSEISDVSKETDVLIMDPGEPIRNQYTEELLPNIVNRHVIIEKGANYVTTTFMCIELQQLLTQHQDDLSIETYPFVLGEQIEGISNDSELVIDYVFNPLRGYDNSTNISFTKSNIYKCGSFAFTYQHVVYICKVIPPFNSHQSKRSHEIIDYVLSYSNIDLKNNIIRVWKEHFFPIILNFQIKEYPEDKRQAISEILTNFNKNNIEPSTIMALTYKYLVNYFYIPNFTIDLSEAQQLYTFTTRYDNAVFDLIINSCNFSENNTGARYCLFFYQYNYANSTNNAYDGTYNFPLNIISLDEDNNAVNKMGVYHKYLNVGPYLCKIMEYKMQMEYLNEDRTIVVDGLPVYNFVGDLFTDMWPFNP
jgi:hypothetical protein